MRCQWAAPAPLLYIYLGDGRTHRLPLLEWKQTHIFLAPGKLGTPAIAQIEDTLKCESLGIGLECNLSAQGDPVCQFFIA